MPRVVRQQQAALKPFWTTDDGSHVRLYHGDVCKVLAGLPEKSVQCCITSPPYWALRSYLPGEHEDKSKELGSEEVPDCGHHTCSECFVCHMLAVFRGVYRVLRDDGVLFLNLGDTYAGGSSNNRGGMSKIGGGQKDQNGEALGFDGRQRDTSGLPRGNLVGIPWRVALALQADGWVLRQDIIWHKPSPMPESVRNRCTKAHEYVFLLTKGPRYYYDAEAVKEKVGEPTRRNAEFRGESSPYKNNASYNNSVDIPHASRAGEDELSGRNKRSVWTVSSQGYEGAHFATFPPKLIEPMILAGTSAYGACAECLAPWRRVTAETKLRRERPNDYVKRTGEEGTGNSCSNSVAGVDVRTVGWEKSCSCETDEVVPCTVLDPFIGSGTVCDVAVRFDRRSVGIDLNADYLRNFAVPRITAACLAGPDEVRELVRSSRPKPKRMW